MNKLRITTFGAFTISCGDCRISEKDNRTKKLWRLIKYLIANRDRRIPQDELVDIVGSSDNTDGGSSLKTMLHRLRNTLDQLGFPESRSLILQKNGSYYWNTDIPAEIDEELFLGYIDESNKSDSKAIKADLRVKALELYGGYYLDKAFEDVRVLTERIQSYHVMYIRLFEEAAEYYSSVMIPEKVISLANDAIDVDPYQEVFHYYLIRASIDAGQHENALIYYRRVSELFLGKFRINPSDRIRTLYRYIIKERHYAEKDISVIMGEIIKKSITNQPIYCEFDTFRVLCGAALNRTETGNAFVLVPYLMLVTLEPRDERALPSEKQTDNAMSAIKRILCEKLTKLDVVTRYSVTQYITIVFARNDDDADDIKMDIFRTFKAYLPSTPMRLCITSSTLC